MGKTAQYIDREYVLKGGIVRHLSTFRYTNAGFWTVSGMHGDDEDSLTKCSGSELFSSTSLGARVVGLFQVTLNNNVFYFAMANGNVVSVSGSTVTTLLSGEASGYYQAVTLNSIFYFASGVNANKKILSNLSVQNVGIAAPTVAPVAAAGTPGPLTGDYSWKYTFKNSVTGVESNPSPVSNTITLGAVYAALSSLNNSSDTQVDRKVIYRTTNGGDGLWFRVAEIDAALTTYIDGAADGDLAELVLEDSGVPPQSSLIELYNGMIVYAGQASPNRNRVSVSGVLRPESVDPDNDQDLSPDEDDFITGMKVFGSTIAVYKRRALFIGNGTSPDAINFTRTRVKEGSLGGRGIIEHNSSHFYLSERGPFAYSGLREDFIGRSIQHYYKTLDVSLLANASGVKYTPLNQLIWNVGVVGDPDATVWLCFNTETKEWTTREFGSSTLSTYFDALGRTRLWLGGSNGYLYTGDVGSGDNGANIPVEIVTRGLCLSYQDKQPDTSQTYCFRHIDVRYDANGGTAPVTVDYAIDKPDANFVGVKNKATGLSSFVPATGSIARFDLAGYGRLIFLRFTTSSTEALKIRGVKLYGTALGRKG